MVELYNNKQASLIDSYIFFEPLKKFFLMSLFQILWVCFLQLLFM